MAKLQTLGHRFRLNLLSPRHAETMETVLCRKLHFFQFALFPRWQWLDRRSKLNWCTLPNNYDVIVCSLINRLVNLKVGPVRSHRDLIIMYSLSLIHLGNCSTNVLRRDKML